MWIGTRRARSASGQRTRLGVARQEHVATPGNGVWLPRSNGLLPSLRWATHISSAISIAVTSAGADGVVPPARGRFKGATVRHTVLVATLALSLLVSAVLAPLATGSVPAKQDGWFWQSPIPQGEVMIGACFVGASSGWMVGQGGSIEATTDGGASWWAQDSQAGAELYLVTFIDDANGWAVGRYQDRQDGASWCVLGTADGGASWRPLSSSDSTQPSDITFVDERHGWWSAPAA